MRRSSSLIFSSLCSAFVGMIAWWSPTFSSSTTRASGSRSRPVTYWAAAAYSGRRPTCAAVGLISADHVAREEARAGARVRQRLVLLVAALRGAERAPRGEPEAGVGLALQRREVVEQRRALALLGLVELGDLARLAADGGDDRLGLLRGADPGALEVVAALVLARALGREPRVDQPVRLGHERADLLLAAGEDRQRRRLHPAQRHRAVERGAQPDRRRARRVHADDPVRLRARPRRLPRAWSAPRRRAGARRRRASPCSVMDDSHSRWTGFFAPAFSYR